jgi:23S rRNA pseudouridine1911/1915/1917 synthase
MTFWQAGHAIVSIFSAAGESIGRACHAVAKMAMNEDAPQHLFSSAETAPFLGRRLDVFLAAVTGKSRSRVQAWLKAGRVRIEPATARAEASYKLRAGDSVAILREFAGDAPVPESAPRGEAIALDILFEDEALLALNKPPGLVVHPAAGHRTGTLVNALVHHRGADLAARGGAERLGIVHRLDKDTSGVILVAKTDDAHEKLARAFASREVRKFYRALCWGRFRRPSGSCREAIGRHRVHRQKMTVLKSGGRASHTDYRVLAQGAYGAEVECELHTGRTHQIRVHLAHLGHSVWGDHLYGRPHPLTDGFEPARQMLHAARIEIAHPLTGQTLRLEAPLPEDYVAARDQLKL